MLIKVGPQNVFIKQVNKREDVLMNTFINTLPSVDVMRYFLFILSNFAKKINNRVNRNYNMASVLKIIS